MRVNGETMQAIDQARIELLALLDRRGYRFVTPTPATHATVLARRPTALARNLRDVLGWSRPFDETSIDEEALGALRRAELIEGLPGNLQAALRVSSLNDRLLLHSRFPTTATDAVFFGPDSYRFANLIVSELPATCGEETTIVDIGTGTGVGAIVAATACPGSRVIGTDINKTALDLARVNAAVAMTDIDFRHGNILGDVEGEPDIVLANPPYIIDDEGRTYRDGGSAHGAELSLRMVAAVLPRLATGGRFILYTGSAIVNGHDCFRDAASALAHAHGCMLRYREVDPDVFGEELLRPAYAEVERIAAVAAIFDKAR